MYWHERTSDIGGSSPFRLPLPLLPLSHYSHRLPLIQLQGLGVRCKLPQRVRVEPGHQTHFGAFSGKNEAFQETDAAIDLFYDSTNHEINYVDENNASYA